MKSHNDVRKKIEDYSYGLVDVICRGTSGVIYEGINDKTREKVAIKVIDCKTIKSLNGKYILENETQALRKLNHQNIVKVLDIYSTANNRYILTEYCDGGDLEQFFSNRKGNPLSELQALVMFRGIYQGFIYMIKRGFIHRRIEPRNILIKDGVCKINNFSMVRKDPIVSKKDIIEITNVCYCSPEVLESNVYSQKSDIWSLGVILYEMLHSETPWLKVSTPNEQLSQVHKYSLSFSKKLSDQCKDFISKCLEIQQNKRFSIFDIQNHAFTIKLLGDGLYKDEYISPIPLIKMKSGKLKQPTRQQRSIQEKTIDEQINFMRYMYKIHSLLPKGSLKFMLLKQLLSTLQALKEVCQMRNSFSIQRFDQMVEKGKTQQYIGVIDQYCLKYSKLYVQFQSMISKSTTDPLIKPYLNKNLERSEGLSMSIIQCCIRQIKQIYKNLKDASEMAQLQETAILPDRVQKLALLLDMVTTYYQLNCLLIDDWNNLANFARISKVRTLAQVSPCLLQKMHVRYIENKLNQLDIL